MSRLSTCLPKHLRVGRTCQDGNQSSTKIRRQGQGYLTTRITGWPVPHRTALRPIDTPKAVPSRVRSTGLGANAHISGGKLRRGCCGLPCSRESALLTVAGDAFILSRLTASYSYSCASTPGKSSPAAIRAFCPQFRAVRFSLHHTPHGMDGCKTCRSTQY